MRLDAHNPNLELTKPGITEKYKDINSTNKMSDTDIDNFWKNEFAKAKENAALDIRDRLISEIFNRSESELEIDFEIDAGVLKVLEIFDDENWQKLSTGERLSAVEMLSEAIGTRLGIARLPGIEVYNENDENYGSYDKSQNVIKINEQHMDNPKELVNTVAHELRHAYQNMRADKLETWEDALFRYNFDNYISTVPLPGGGYLFFTDYQDQYVEVDARAFANKFTEAMA